jgi:hypothetical protein
MEELLSKENYFCKPRTGLNKYCKRITGLNNKL